MNYTEADHIWFIERIEAYLGGDLAGDELARFESHAAACLPCEAKLGDGSRADTALRELFAAHRPAAGLEDRAIAGVRTVLDQHRPRLLLNPRVRRAASVAAAALVVAAMGYVGKLALDGGSLSRFNPGRLLAKSPKDVVARIRGTPLASRTGGANDELSDKAAAVLRRRAEPYGVRNLVYRGEGTDAARQEEQHRADEPEARKTVETLTNTAQQSIRDAKYKEALTTIDQIMVVDPNNDYARGVRPLVKDKMELAQQRGYRREFDENMERSLNQTEEKRIPYEDIMRYPANWSEISEVRDRTVAHERQILSGKAGDNLAFGRSAPAVVAGSISGGGSLKVVTGRDVLTQKTDVAQTATVLDGGTLLLGGQTVALGTSAHGLGASSTENALEFKDVKLRAGLTSTGAVDGTATPTIIIQKDVGQKQLPLLSEKLSPKQPEAATPERSDPGIVKSGSGTVVLNGENAFTGGTTVTAGTLNWQDSNHATGKDGTVAQGTLAPAHGYGYVDPVAAPKPADVQYAKLGDVASATDNRTHHMATWAFDDRFKTDRGDSDGDTKKEAKSSPPAEVTLNRASLSFGSNDARGTSQALDESTKDRLPGLEADHKDKPAVAQTDAESAQLTKTAGATSGGRAGAPAEQAEAGVSKLGVNGEATAGKPAAMNGALRAGDAASSVEFYTTPLSNGRAQSATGVEPRLYEVQDLSRQVPDFNPPPQVALAGEIPPATGAAPTTASTGVAPAASQAGGPAAQQPPAPIQRKIIRNGEVIFEVDSFDSSYMQIGKIVAEEGGYIGTTDSEKLPNGKVKGTVTVRIPPDRLDVLVLKLRGLGDLKNQKITAQDVTKQFVDSDSLLRADKAMYDRLLDLIKSGKGEVKDLVAAEKELGNYREKIEQLEGELRYLQSQVSLSTLNITLFERNIKTPTAAFEAETVDTAIETEEVEKARADAIKSVEDAKGRVIESQMKRFEAGQLQATIVAEVAPENAGPVIDRLKQLGHVARFDVERKQTTQGGQGAPVGLKLEKRATVLKVSIYNLANIAPRETVNVSLAAEDVEKAYKAILAAAEVEEQVNGVKTKVGRVVSSSLNSQRADQTTGNITIEVRADKAATVEAAIRSAGGTGGEVMHMTVTENPDANNVTRAKRGYVVTLASLSSVAPRETAVLSVAAKDVPALYQTLMNQLQAGPGAEIWSGGTRVVPGPVPPGGTFRGRIYASRLDEQDRQNVEAFVDFEIPRGESANIEALLNSGATSDVFRRNVTRSPDVTNTLDSKVRMQVSILNVGRLRPREESMFSVEVADPEAALLTVQGIATAAGGRTYEPHLNKDESGKIEGQVAFDVPLSAAQTTADKLRALGTVRQSRSLTNESVPAGTLAKARFDVTVVNAKQLVAANHGVGLRIREGVGTSLDALLLLLEWVIVVAPFVLVLWILWKLFRRGRGQPVETKPATA